MKLTLALSTLVSLSTFASAAPQKYNLLNARQFTNNTGGAGVDAGNNNRTSSLPAATTTNGGGAGVMPDSNSAGVTTATVISTVVSTVTQQYTTFPVTDVFTATLTLPGGGAGVAPAATDSPTGTAGSTANPSVVVVAGSGTGATSGTTGTTGSSGTGSSGSSSGSGSGSNACVCSAQTVVATGIYTVTVADVISLGSVVYTTTYPSTTLGAMTIAGGSVVGAVQTVTKAATVATNTNAALPAGQAYQTVTIPASSGQPATTVVIIISVITDNVAPVTTTVTPATTNDGGAGAGAQGLSTTAGPFTNVTMTLSTNANPTAPVSASVTLPTTTASTSASVSGAAGAGGVANTSGQSTVSTAAPTVTPTATTAADGAVSTAPVGGTEVSAVGDQGSTPLYNQAAFISAILDYHNELRARHGAPTMTWNQDLADFALTNANANAADRTFLHTKEMGLTDPYGENIATQYGYNNPEYLVYLWYNEIKSYDYSNPVFSESTGHFTQLVWDASTELGCAYVRADDANQNYLLTCEYSAPGNYAGEFSANVNEPIVSGDAAQPSMYI